MNTEEQDQTYETYNHRILWGAAERNLGLATPSSADAKFFALGAMYLFFAAFEGYLNWLGTRIAPEVWEDERKFFSGSPFNGTLGKYRFLAKILCLPNPDPSHGPFQTATSLKKLRDMVAHPKPEAGTRTVKVKAGKPPRHYQGELEKEVSERKAKRAQSDLKKLVEQLHCKAKLAYPSNVLESNAIGPILGTTITTL